MAGLKGDTKLRAVITGLEAGYVVSVSELSVDGGIAVLGEEEVGSLLAAHAFIEQTATDHGTAVRQVAKLYNMNGKITDKAPRGRL